MCQVRQVTTWNPLRRIPNSVYIAAEVDPITQQWLERAEYDLETARSLLQSQRYLYVAFMCQQTLEKYLKAFMTSLNKTPPFLHNLPRLAEEAVLLSDLTEERQRLLADLNPYYIKARYGEYKSALSKVCTANKASDFLKKTEEPAKWLRAKIR